MLDFILDGGRLEFREATMDVQEAVRNVWRALTSVFSCGQSMTRRILRCGCGQGFPGAQPGNHTSARAQEHIISEACRIHARVVLLEASYVAVVLHMGRQVAVPGAGAGPTGRRRQADSSVVGSASLRAWESLDTIDCQELFLSPAEGCLSVSHSLEARLWATTRQN